MQLITKLTATVSYLVSSNSASTPLGKMRGLITVKLANEQVNCRTKFQNCHFSERCSNSCSEGLKQKVGGKIIEKEGRQDKMALSAFSDSRKLSGFCNS